MVRAARKWSVLGIAVACLLVVAAQIGSAATKTTLVYQTFTYEEIPIEKELVRKFEETHPNIKIQVDVVPANEAYQKVLLTSKAGKAPDVYQSFWTYDVASNGLALNLDEYISKEGGKAFVSRYAPAAWGMGVYRGSAYALPFRTGCSITYINKTLFKNAGIEVPTKWDWKQFTEIAKKLTIPEKGQYGFSLSGSTTDPATDWQFWPFLLQAGGKVLENNRAVFDSPEGVEALTFLVDLIHKHKVVPPGVASADMKEQIDLFAGNKIAMFQDGPWFIQTLLVQYPGLDFAIAPMPTYKKDGSIAGGTTLCISSASKHKDEAWEFIKFMTSDKILRDWAISGRFIPASIEAAKDPFFQQPHYRVAIQQMQMPGTITANLYPEVNQLNAIMRGYLQAAYLKTMEPKEALSRAAAEWNEILKKYD